MATPALAGDDAPTLGQDDPAAQAGLEKQELTRQQAIAKARADERIDGWVSRYDDVTTSAGLDDAENRWTVHFRVPGKDAGEIAQAVVDARSGQVLEAWTGPQVAWKMARGYRDAFGHKLNRPAIWLAFCLAFLVAVIDWRRPLRLLNLDLLALIAFSFSLGAFNEGMIFWSVPLAYPPLLYLTGRLGWIGVKGRRQGAWTGRLPIWALAGLAVFLIGFRGGLNAYDSGVIDVGYAGVVGADRILSGTSPYGTIPERTSDGCGPKFSDGNYSAYRQESGRCESFATGIDTYGPVNYAAYVPAVAALGWTGRWDDLPAAHVTSLVFDALTGIGLLLLGRRLRGWRLGALLSCAWFAYPFTAYALQSNSNDMIVSALLVWALLAATHPLARGVFLGLATLAKFAPALLIPLWLRYPRRERPAVEEWTPGEVAPTPPAGLRARAAGLFRDLGPLAPGGGVHRRPAVLGAGGGDRALAGRDRRRARRLRRDLRQAARPRVAVLALGLAPAQEPARLPGSVAARVAPAHPHRRLRAARGAAAAAARHGAPGGALGRAAGLVPDRALALVVPVSAVALRARDRGPVCTQRRGLTAALAAACAAVALVTWFGVLSRPDPDGPQTISDTPLYAYYAGLVGSGELPYRDFVYEYPPLSLAALLPPMLPAEDQADYDRWFGRLMAALLAVATAATVAALAAAGHDRARQLAGGLLVGVGPAVAGPVALTRYDLWPVALVALALWALAAGRHRLCGALLGLGVAAKLWPALLLPWALARARAAGDLRRTAIAGAAAVALPFALALALSPTGLWDSLDLQAGRGLQIESTPAALLLGLAEIGIGGPYAAVTARTGQDLSEGWSGAAQTLSTLLAAAAVLACAVLAWRAGRRPDRAEALSEGARWSLAAVVAAVALGKVLSPQFLLWLLPLPLLVRGLRGWCAWSLLLLALVLTQAEFPGRYWLYVAFQRDAIALVLARDLLLVALLVLLAVPCSPARAAGSAARCRALAHRRRRRRGRRARARRPRRRSCGGRSRPAR